MKNLFLTLFVLFLCSNCAFAIDWLEVVNPNGRRAYLDVDSVITYKNYYFYNIKVKNANNEDVVVTVQSAKSNPFSAQIKSYSVSEYIALEGDYNNITLYITKNLEPVTYDSTVNACYKQVKKIIQKKTAPALSF